MWQLEREKKKEERREENQQVPLPPVPLREKCAYELFVQGAEHKGKAGSMEKGDFFKELTKCKPDMTQETVGKAVAPKKVRRKIGMTERKREKGNKETEEPGSRKSGLQNNQIDLQVDDQKNTGSSKKGIETELYDYMVFFLS